jgi:hypothetical protein
MPNTIKQECKNICNTLNITNIDFNNDNWKEIFKNNVDWENISYSQKLSEIFIKEFKDSVNWYIISSNQKLSEEFIKAFKDKVDWYYISYYQKLSEEFIKEFKDYVDWENISKYQKLSEGFIKEFKDSVDWENISKYQKLSEGFIKEFKDSVDWENISRFQKLSEEFIKDNNLDIDKDNWNYWNIDDKLQIIRKYYEILEDDGGKYIEVFKGIRNDRYSKYNFQYCYNIGEEYESHCDCTNTENSFGLSAWNYEKAKEYCDELVIKVKIYVKDIGRVVHDGGKIRCSKFLVLS